MRVPRVCVLARRLGLKIVADYRQLYDRAYDIHLFILLDPDPQFVAPGFRHQAEPAAGARQSGPLTYSGGAFKSREKLLQQRSEEIQTILNGIQDLILVFTPNQEIVRCQ